MPVGQSEKSFKNIIVTPLHVKGAGSLYFNSIIWSLQIVGLNAGLQRMCMVEWTQYLFIVVQVVN